MKTHRRQIAAAALSLCAAFTLLTSPVSAASQATEEDIYRALEEIGMPQSFIITTRNNANSPDTYRDEDGMEIPDTHRAMMRFRMHLPISVPRYTIIRKNRAN